MKVISVFNNKGGVGKTTLTFHLAHALAELGHPTLLMDLDPQCNLTIFGMAEEDLHKIWQEEDSFIDDFKRSRDQTPRDEFAGLLARPRSAHFLVKPVEDGTEELDQLSPPVRLRHNLDLVPGRLTLHMYEDRIATRWSDVYRGDPLAIRTVTRVRSLARQYADAHSYEFVILDTSPSLGALNKVLISTADGFLVPCMPDMFSLYGIRNIGKSLSAWKGQFDTIFNLISNEKRNSFPREFVSFLGFTIYNARKYTGGNNEWDLAQAHFNYAKQIPRTIRSDIPESVRAHLTRRQIEEPIGGTSIMHSHATMPGMAQKYKVPLWAVPDCGELDQEDKYTISGNRQRFEDTGPAYHSFASDLLKRVAGLGK